jgi:hypothetical protein
MKLDVPYYSQFVDVTDPFWMLRACGATSLKMVAEYHGKKVPDIISLCEEAKEKGGYDMVNGWVHDYIVHKAEALGLQAHRREIDQNIINEVIESLKVGNPVIVSVEKRVLEQRRFHIIVLVGYEGVQTSQTKADRADDIDTFKLIPTHGFYYHEPESTDKERGAYRFCDVETFLEYWRGKAIFITK